MNVLATAEEAGSVPEMLEHQAEYFEEESQRRMQRLTKVAAVAVWVLIATLIIVAIFRLALTYFNMIGGRGI